MANKIDYQARLGSALCQLFPNYDIKENVRKEAGISSGRGRFLELDYWIPALNVAFEYQDPYHYNTTWFQTSIEKKGDKEIVVVTRNETLIPIPYWWDGSKESLAATIKQRRPDLLNDLLNSSSPITSQPPETYFPDHSIKGVGELMLASFPSSNVDNLISHLGKWWLSEKYDGVRVCWNPETNALCSRFGRSLTVKESVVTSIQVKDFIEGELWFGRSSFQESYQLSQQNDVPASSLVPTGWPWLRMNVFDAPSTQNHSTPFELRYRSLLSMMSVTDLKIPLQDPLHWKSLVIKEQGEGVIMRSQASYYHPGRSPLLVKFKTHRDQDGLVLEHLSELVYLLLLPNGDKCIAINHSGCVLLPGDIVNFIFKLVAGIPEKDATTSCYIQRKRNDVEWRDLVSAEKRSFSTASPSKAGSKSIEFNGRKSPGYWSSAENFPANIRQFFDKIARDNNMDGTIPESWFSFSKKDILQEDGGGSILKHFSSSVRLALASAYPDSIGVIADDIAFRTGFSNLPTKLWNDKFSRKEFLAAFSAQKGYSPTDLDAWQRTSEGEIKRTKGGTSFMRYCNRQRITLMDVVHDCFFNRPYKSHLEPVPSFTTGSTGWKREMRSFFESVAGLLSFDTKQADNWYANFQAVNSIAMRDKIGKSALRHYGSTNKALAILFPELELSYSKFETLIDSKRNGESFIRKRSFFENLSRKQGFDPLVAENWYCISRHTIASMKGSEKILQGGATIASVLQEAFPELHFEPHQFQRVDPAG